jgi:hypothetical protein
MIDMEGETAAISKTFLHALSMSGGELSKNRVLESKAMFIRTLRS